MHTVFRSCDIKPMNENNRLFQVDLTLASDDDQDLQALNYCIRVEALPNAVGWNRLGLFLLKMQQFDIASQMYEILFEQTNDEFEKGFRYNQIGWDKENQGEYKEARVYLTKSLEIHRKTISPYHPILTSCYKNLGLAYANLGEYSQALSSYKKKALKIRRQSYPLNHPELTASYNRVGTIY